MPQPKVFLFNSKSGSGVETTGNTIEAMFIGMGNFFVYRHQNPPSIIYKELMIQKPDVIIINEVYHRILDAVYYYKQSFPNTKIILLNHCYPNLVNISVREYGEASHDQLVLIKSFIKNEIDHIINLNYRPSHINFDKEIINKTKEIYFPIGDRFKIETPWSERKKDFMFLGAFSSAKFSIEFLNLLERTGLNIDTYGRKDVGRTPSDEKVAHSQRMIESKNLTYGGYIPDDKLVSTINEYKFYIVPHKGPEPFMLTIAESIRCGTIPLVTNERSYPQSYWLDWAKDCYLEYNDPKRLLDKMMYYMNNKRNGELNRTLQQKSQDISKIMTDRTNFDKFKTYLFSLIYN